MTIRGGLAGSAALETLAPEHLLSAFGDERVRAVTDLPDDVCPYVLPSAARLLDMTLAEVLQRIRAGAYCYMTQTSLDRFEGARASLPLDALTGARAHAVNLWVGGRTSSGLHYDYADNLLCQIHGQKRAILIDPRFGRSLRPFADNPTKSRLTPGSLEDVDDAHAVAVPRWIASLGPGDVLFIPRGWWHQVTATGGISVSVNCWFGRSLTRSERFRRTLSAGLLVWLRTLRDFVVYGLLRRPPAQRPFSPPPLGLRLYRSISRDARG